MAFLARHEWLLLELLVLGAALYELWSINRQTRQDRRAKVAPPPPEA